MVKIRVRYLGKYRTQCLHEESGSTIETDAPKDIGGEGALFSPTDLLATGLGSCMLTSMGLAAQKLGIELKDATADVEKIMSAAPPRKISKLIVRIRCPHLVDALVREKLEKAALQCPVHASLHPDVKQEIDFIWGI
ncbi:MAG: OsmC family protein [Verrucomicrobia bacterium]|nr:OsmC family protein [Verrucomicrobiota bacterium]